MTERSRANGVTGVNGVTERREILPIKSHRPNDRANVKRSVKIHLKSKSAVNLCPALSESCPFLSVLRTFSHVHHVSNFTSALSVLTNILVHKTSADSLPQL